MDIKDLTEKHYSLAIVRDVTAICEPLIHHGVTYFGYLRLFKDKSTYALTNNGGSYYNHFKKQYPVDQPYPKKILGEKFHYLPFLDAPNTLQNQLREYRDMYGADNPIFFIETHKNYTDIFIYASTPGNLDIINFYVNNIDVLEKFKFYFKEKAKKLIEKSNKNKIILANHMWSNFGRDTNNPAPSPSKQKLLKQLAAKHYALSVNSKEILITQRELDVLKALSDGSTTKEAAYCTKLSPRTVESYLKNIRTKLGIHKKSEIIKLLFTSSLLN